MRGFPSRDELVERYAERSGRDVEPLAWFQALALWKAAVFCEAIYGRYIRGELAAEDTNAARFEQGCPCSQRPRSVLVRLALRLAGDRERDGGLRHLRVDLRAWLRGSDRR